VFAYLYCVNINSRDTETRSLYQRSQVRRLCEWGRVRGHSSVSLLLCEVQAMAKLGESTASNHCCDEGAVGFKDLAHLTRRHCG
jgi:hypothetical protein